MIGHTPKYPPELSHRLAHDAVSLAYMCDIGGWTPAYVRQLFYELPQITTKHFYNHHQSSFSLHCIAILDVILQLASHSIIGLFAAIFDFEAMREDGDAM